MSDKLREAALAALDLLNNDDRDCAFAAGILRVALAEPVIKESLTVAEPEPSPSSPLPPLARAPHDSTSPCRTSQKLAKIGKTPLCPG